jgi:predicted  nucleic acid-binding Zn-ribbon protein
MEALKKTFEERTQEINSLNSTITELKERQAKLETIIEKERTASTEKVELL